MKSEEYKRGFDAGYKQALRDALKDQRALATALQGRELKPLARPQPTVKFGEQTPW